MRNVPGEKKIVTVVAAALVRADRRILLARRPEGKPMAGLWELPGGKLERGEIPEAALVRELREELGIGVREDHLQPFTFASHAYEDFHLLMPVFMCREWEGEPTPQELQEIAWAAAEDVHDYPAPAADKPLFDSFIEWTRKAA